MGKREERGRRVERGRREGMKGRNEGIRKGMGKKVKKDSDEHEYMKRNEMSNSKKKRKSGK